MITSLLLLATLFLMQARMLLALLATWAHCRLMFNRASANTPRTLSSSQSSGHSSPSLSCYMGLLWPKCRTRHLALLNLILLTSGTLRKIDTTPQLGVICKLTEGVLSSLI